jgi:hypothetical protein
MAKGKKTSKKLASAASKVLKNPKSTKSAKRIAASVLGKAKGKKKKK